MGQIIIDLARELRQFAHKAVDPKRTIVSSSGTSDLFSLSLRIYDYQGAPVSAEKRSFGGTPSLPGIMFELRNHKEVHIKDLYIVDKYQRQGLGMAVVKTLFDAAISSGFCTATLFALNDSAKEYWELKHGFSNTTPRKPLSLQKALCLSPIKPIQKKSGGGTYQCSSCLELWNGEETDLVCYDCGGNTQKVSSLPRSEYLLMPAVELESETLLPNNPIGMDLTTPGLVQEDTQRYICSLCETIWEGSKTTVAIDRRLCGDLECSGEVQAYGSFEIDY